MNDTPPWPQEALDWARHEHGFVPEETITSGYCSWVFLAGDRALKAPWRGEEATTGLGCLQTLSGGVGPRVHAVDQESGATLMERVVPGIPLSDPQFAEVDEDLLFTQLRHRLPVSSAFETSPLAAWFEEPTKLSRALVETSVNERYLHGDLHHENILWGGDRWVVIDGKGVWGESTWEGVAILRNPLARIAVDPMLTERTRQRIYRLSAMNGWRPERLWGWALADQLSEPSESGTAWGKYAASLMELEQEFGQALRDSIGEFQAG